MKIVRNLPRLFFVIDLVVNVVAAISFEIICRSRFGSGALRRVCSAFLVSKASRSRCLLSSSFALADARQLSLSVAVKGRRSCF